MSEFERYECIEVVTSHPIAVDSPDHLYPVGTAQDNYGSQGFCDDVEAFLSEPRPLQCLDLGCAGGQAAVDMHLRGHISLGLEGSDYSIRMRRANWPMYHGTVLHTCDLSRPFEILLDCDPMQFDLVTAWEFLEHLNPWEVRPLLEWVAGHLAPHGLFAGTIGLEGSSVRMSPQHCAQLHQTIMPVPWWETEFSRYFEPIVPCPITHWVRELGESLRFCAKVKP